MPCAGIGRYFGVARYVLPLPSWSVTVFAVAFTMVCVVPSRSEKVSPTLKGCALGASSCALMTSTISAYACVKGRPAPEVAVKFFGPVERTRTFPQRCTLTV